jgi:hypothetical protein
MFRCVSGDSAGALGAERKGVKANTAHLRSQYLGRVFIVKCG